MHSKSRLAILVVSALFVAYALVGGMLGTSDDSEVRMLKELRIFSDVLSKVQSDYVDTPDLNRTLAGAFQGLIDALDPQCSYVAADAVPGVRERNEKYKAGIGVILAKRFGYGYVVAALDGSPAEAAGLRSGDLIENLEGKLTSELSLAEMQSLLHGPEGAPVELTVVRSRNTEPIKLSVARRALETPPLQAKVLESEIGYIRIPDFFAGAGDQVAAKLRMLSSGKLSGLVLDLRGAASGQFDEAVRIADIFLPAGKQIASLRDRHQKINDYVATDEGSDSAVPMVVLTAASTTGAAEVLAAALKENGRAELVGEKTSGIASLQKEMELEDGALLVLTTQLFCTPGGTAIQGENAKKSGVQPHQKVPDEGFVTNFYYQNPNLSGEEQYSRLLQEVDNLQLRRAVEILRAALKKAA
ncbi:MAG: PDZ domain-containing protein [Acidobacteria bacterium]|nr:PDZ domain-containing protein [Acidobacteriota bacterium]